MILNDAKISSCITLLHCYTLQYFVFFFRIFLLQLLSLCYVSTVQMCASHFCIDRFLPSFVNLQII